MFNNKKYLFAIALVAPMFGCPADDTDDTTSTSVGETSASTTAGTSTSTSTTTAGTGTDTTAGTDTGTATTGGTADTGTTGGGGGMACFFTCTEDVDCCAFTADQGMCEAGLGSYPYNITCDRGFCADAGCLENADCEPLGAEYECVDFDGFGACIPTCAEDADCAEGFVCTGEAGDAMFCEQSCETDDDCFGDAFCGDNMTCEFETGCTSDDDCGGPGGTCDMASGTCVCSDDADCARGAACDAI